MSSILNGIAPVIKRISGEFRITREFPALNRLSRAVLRRGWNLRTLVGIQLLAAMSLSAVPPSRLGGYDGGEDLRIQPFESTHEVKRKTPGMFSPKVKLGDSVSQLGYAQAVDSAPDGSRRAAARAYDALVRRWPYSPEAPVAQHRLADVNLARGKLRRAYDDYHYLIHYYPDRVAVREVLAAMFEIASNVEKRGKNEVAKEMYQTIADYAPNWSLAPEALLRSGALQQRARDWFEALETYETVGANYPGTASARVASLEAARILHRLSLRYKEDDAAQIRAQASLAAALRNYPGDEEIGELREKLDEVITRRYERHFDMAVFYDRKNSKPETVIAAYENFVKRFPAAPQAHRARERIEELSQK